MTEKTQGLMTAVAVLVLSGGPAWFYTAQKIDAGWDKTRKAQHKQQGWQEEVKAVEAAKTQFPGFTLTPLTPPPRLTPAGEPVRLEEGGAQEMKTAVAPCMEKWGEAGAGATLVWTPGTYRPILLVAAKSQPPDSALACLMTNLWTRPVEVPKGEVRIGL